MRRATTLVTLVGTIAAAGIAALVPALRAHAQAKGTGETTAFVFFSLQSPIDARVVEELRRDRQLRIRHVLLVQDYDGIRGEPSKELAESIKALQKQAGLEFGLQLYDPDGLAWADRLDIARLPAVAIVRGTHAHVAYGTNPKIQELVRCATK
ncbi:MAG: hypothetical protein HYY16_12635 [Planctomycetes bacterium]|nr:hypothetical protein [Planctomycetota bacterium]